MDKQVTDPFMVGDSEWVSLKFHGQSFMLHQIVSRGRAYGDIEYLRSWRMPSTCHPANLLYGLPNSAR